MKKSYQEVKNLIIMENKSLFVGNPGSNITEDELHEQFSYFGRVRFIRLIKDKINEIDNSHFFIDLHEHGFLNSQPRAGMIKNWSLG